MIVERIRHNIFHFKFPSRYHLCSAFLRIQEFYESPYDEIRGNYFTMDEYMDRYAADNEGMFTYFEDWNGFNIPGDCVNKFWKCFNEHENPIRRKEADIFASLMAFVVENNTKYYIIGTHDGASEAIKHEIAHALYYLSGAYKEACQTIYREMPDTLKASIHKVLEDLGYVGSVFEDEVQAYFASDDHESIKSRFDLDYDVSEWVDRYREAFTAAENGPP